MRTIFVSSTFSDMQLERDAIQDIVMPILNERAKEYGDSVSFCDLRWGIDTSELESEESSRKVMDVCLDEIDRCEHPMIVILGERYGWIPEEHMVSELATNKNLALDDYKKSITALEIEYGALQTKQKLEHTLFYIRHVENHAIPASEAEDEEHERLQNELKDKIKALSVTGIREYTIHDADHVKQDIQAFAKMIIADVEEMLIEDWKVQANYSEIEKENMAHVRFFQEKAKLFTARKQLCNDYIEKLREEKTVVLKALSGTGKSTLTAVMRERLIQEGHQVIAYECGLTSHVSSCFGVLKQLHAAMCELSGSVYDEKDDFDTHRHKMIALCDTYATADNPLFIIVDAVDQLTDDDYREKLDFLPIIANPNVYIFVTCISRTQIQAVHIHILPEMTSEEDKRDVIDGILANHHRELSQQVIEKILKKAGTNNPLYLSFLIQRLLMMNQEDFAQIRNLGNGMDAINQYHANLVEKATEDPSAMGLSVLKLAAKRIAPESLTKVIEYIGMSRAVCDLRILKGCVPISHRSIFHILLLICRRILFCERTEDLLFPISCYPMLFGMICNSRVERKNVMMNCIIIL